ncbi:MAG: tetratricopeptide repeat protein [Candidatus Eisenbacteria bacterium]|nr:tetratricopeptide repeat protein [Candidatus Eisenbacteria bacterium]
MGTGPVVAIVAVAVVVAVLIVFTRRRADLRESEESSYQKGLDALIAGDREAALKHLALTVREDPRNVDAYVKLGNLLRERGQTKQAIQIHRELLVKRRLPAGVRSEVAKNLALDYAEARRWADVIRQVRELPRGERSDERMLALARDAYEAVGDFDRAIARHRDILKSGKSEEPSLGVYRAHAAVLALERGDSVRARSEFQTALKEDPAAAVASLYLGDIAAGAGDLERATGYWMKLVADRPDCAHLVFDRLEKAYYELGDFGRMMSIYQDVAAKAPTSVHTHRGLSRMLERKGDIEGAIEAAREAVKHEGDTLAGHRQLVDVLVRSERFEEAARAAEELLSARALAGDEHPCPACGRRREKPGWRCPHCGAWTDAC